MINVFQPTLGEEEILSLKETFDSHWIGKGKKVAAFESLYANHIGSKKENVLSTNCCTEGLFSSMKLLEIGPGDEVIVPTISFVGAGNAVCSSGAKMVLCDVDPRTLNARAEDIEKCITNKTKAILLLHYGGIPCDMDNIMYLKNKYNLHLIEDCAAGVCSSYHGKALGTFGEIGMWSFDAMKILVCGDGAMLHFGNPELKEKAEKLLYFGLTTKSGYENSVADKWWEFDVSCFGHRAIMNDLTASIAIEQFYKLPSFMAKRMHVHNFYNKNLSDIDWIDLPLPIDDTSKTSYYFYHIQVKNGERDHLAQFLRANGIYTTYRYYPLHRVHGYNINGNFPNADYAADNTLCLPMHQSLIDDELNFISEKIHLFDKQFC